MKKLLLALALLLTPASAWAQCNGVFPNNTVCGNVTGAGNLPRPTSPAAFSGTAGGTAGQIQYNNAGSLGGFTASGDATVNTSTGAVTVTKSSGTAFGTFAFQNYATPPAIGGTTPAAGTFSPLTASAITGSTQCVHASSTGVLSGTGTDCFGVPTVQGPYVTSTTLTSGAGGVSSGRSYTGVSIGTANAGRTVIVVNGFRTGPAATVASMTIGGIAATKVAQQVNTAANNTVMSVWTAAVPTGATATIVTTYSGNVDSAEGIAVYTSNNLTVGMTATVGSNDHLNPTMMIPVRSGGFAIFGAWALAQTSAITWFGGATADYAMLVDPTSTSQYQYGASFTNSSSNQVFGVAAEYGVNCGSNECAAIAASFK